MTTLAEALEFGQGTERPFRCHMHPDASASASVNVLKMVWVCYACHAAGVVDSDRVPTGDELLAMLEPEQACRLYPESWLAVYGYGGYWAERFPDWVCWLHGLGEDPWTGEAVFPVHTAGGLLAGFGRRSHGGEGPRYRYPSRWSASRSLFGSRGRVSQQDVVVLVEGAADAAAMSEVGIMAHAVYGSGVHTPQVAMVAAMAPRLVLFAFDGDDAGRRATELSYDALHQLVPTGLVQWDEGSDPASSEPGVRLDKVLHSVAGGLYGVTSAQVAAEASELVSTIRTSYLEESS